MKTKSFLVFSTSVFATSLFLLIFHTQQPSSIQNIVSNTHRHIKDFQENLWDVESSQLVQEEKYFHFLGVDGSAEKWHNTTVPAIVTYGYGDSHAAAVSFLRAAAKLPYTVLLYDLGLNAHSLAVVSNYCNSSKCMVLEFDTSLFPSHVSDLSIHAFRPLIIQHALSRVGAVIYADPLYHWAGSPSDLQELWAKVSAKHGILTWPRRPAVTSLTHPRMFQYFHADVDDFLFVQMVDASRVMVEGKLMQDVMKYWIQCALTLECIMPIGAQSVGCRFDKKPQYRYSGCHGQDSSALSIVLGRGFHFEEHHYTYRGHRVYWRKYTEQEVRDEYQLLERNSTETESKTDQTDVVTVKGVT